MTPPVCVCVCSDVVLVSVAALYVYRVPFCLRVCSLRRRVVCVCVCVFVVVST